MGNNVILSFVYSTCRISTPHFRHYSILCLIFIVKCLTSSVIYLGYICATVFFMVAMGIMLNLLKLSHYNLDLYCQHFRNSTLLCTYPYSSRWYYKLRFLYYIFPNIAVVFCITLESGKLQEVELQIKVTVLLFSYLFGFVFLREWNIFIFLQVTG